MSDVILHHYDASPFTQKALRMLGIKQLAWRSVVTPAMLPKPDLVAMTGGYRGTPVMQIGADIYIDSQLIAHELERRFPQPSLFPANNAGMSYAIVKWADAFFRVALNMVIPLTSSSWPAEFRQDRRDLFPDIDFDTVEQELPYAKSQLRAHASFLDQQLADGRKFLTGDKPGLMDVQAFGVPWIVRAYMPVLANELLAQFRHLPAWEARVAAIGEGARTEITAADAFAVSRAATSIATIAIDANEAQGLTEGMRVSIAPDDSRRGEVVGDVVIATANEIAVRRRHEHAGEVVVHFPRLGYRVLPAS